MNGWQPWLQQNVVDVLSPPQYLGLVFFVRNWSLIATHHLLLPVVVVLLVGQPIQKSIRLCRSVVSNRIGMKFSRIVLQLNTRTVFWLSWIFDLPSAFLDGSHYVISRRKVPWTDEQTRSVCRHLCSSIRQFLIYSTFAYQSSFSCQLRIQRDRKSSRNTEQQGHPARYHRVRPLRLSQCWHHSTRAMPTSWGPGGLWCARSISSIKVRWPQIRCSASNRLQHFSSAQSNPGACLSYIIRHWPS